VLILLCVTPQMLSILFQLQDASHVIVQRSFQMEIDLDQTAVLLCQEMQEGADRNVTICQLQARLAWEQEHRILAMAAMSTLTAQVQLKDQELLAQADEHSKTKVQVPPCACSCNANKFSRCSGPFAHSP